MDVWRDTQIETDSILRLQKIYSISQLKKENRLRTYAYKCKVQM